MTCPDPSGDSLSHRNGLLSGSGHRNNFQCRLLDQLRYLVGIGRESGRHGEYGPEILGLIKLQSEKQSVLVAYVIGTELRL